MRVSRCAKAAVAAVVSLLAFGFGGAASASVPGTVSQPQLRQALLPLPQLATASGTGYPAQSTGRNCAMSPELTARICLWRNLRSDQARAARAPWVTHLNILSFRTANEARQYVTAAGSDRPQTLSSSRTRVVAFDPRSMVSDGVRIEPAPEVSVFQAAGAHAVWAACADPAGQAGVDALAACASGVADAQTERLPRP